jgi:hypothetical protein
MSNSRINPADDMVHAVAAATAERLRDDRPVLFPNEPWAELFKPGSHVRIVCTFLDAALTAYVTSDRLVELFRSGGTIYLAIPSSASDSLVDQICDHFPEPLTRLKGDRQAARKYFREKLDKTVEALDVAHQRSGAPAGSLRVEYLARLPSYYAIRSGDLLVLAVNSTSFSSAARPPIQILHLSHEPLFAAFWTAEQSSLFPTERKQLKDAEGS